MTECEALWGEERPAFTTMAGPDTHRPSWGLNNEPRAIQSAGSLWWTGSVRGRMNKSIKSMKRKQLIRWCGLAAVVGLACAVAFGGAMANGTKKFKETGQEYIVTALSHDALPQPFFAEARALHGPETVVWCGVLHQFSECNVGGRGNSVAFEQVHYLGESEEFPMGTIIYVMKYEVVANGDKLVGAGWFIPQADGSLVAEMEFLPEQGTGRFAGATGLATELRAIPGGYVIEGTITMVGPTSSSE